MIKMTFISLLSVGCILPQSTDLTKKPIIQTFGLNEYVETFPSTAFSTPNTPLVTKHPIKVSTTVTIFINGLMSTPIAMVIKTTDPITITLGVDQVRADTTVTVSYKSVE